MGSTGRLQSTTRQRAAAWTTSALALLSVAAASFWALVFADSVRHATGFGLGRPMLLLLGAVLTSVGVVGSGVATRSAWRRPSRSEPAILAATLGLAAACVGGLLIVRSYDFHVMPRIDGDASDHKAAPFRA